MSGNNTGIKSKADNQSSLGHLPNQSFRIDDVEGFLDKLRQEGLEESAATNDSVIQDLVDEARLKGFYGKVEKSLNMIRERSSG